MACRMNITMVRDDNGDDETRPRVPDAAVGRLLPMMFAAAMMHHIKMSKIGNITVDDLGGHHDAKVCSCLNQNKSSADDQHGAAVENLPLRSAPRSQPNASSR